MTTFEFKPSGVCSTKMIFEMDGDTIQSLQVVGGCNGNLKGIGALVRGQKVDDVIERLDGIKCGMKATSCPDQIAQGLKAYKAEKM